MVSANSLTESRAVCHMGGAVVIWTPPQPITGENS